MKKISIWFIAILAILGFSGCGSTTSTPKVPIVKTTERFKISTIELSFKQYSVPKIEYHTKEELEELLIKDITSLLKKANLYTEDENANSLNIHVNYKRRFLGDKSPLATDSLIYPNFSYNIDIFDKKKHLSNISENNLIVQGGFAMNMLLIAGTLRDKKYEIEFIEAIAKAIITDIKRITLK